MENKFIIIIASYNNEDWVETNLASIINQTYTNYEVFYVDDCSTDNTYNIVISSIDSNKFTVIRNDENLGGTYNYSRFFIGTYQAKRPGYISISSRPTHIGIIKNSPTTAYSGVESGFSESSTRILSWRKVPCTSLARWGSSSDLY